MLLLSNNRALTVETNNINILHTTTTNQIPSGEVTRGNAFKDLKCIAVPASAFGLT